MQQADGKNVPYEDKMYTVKHNCPNLNQAGGKFSQTSVLPLGDEEVLTLRRLVRAIKEP